MSLLFAAVAAAIPVAAIPPVAGPGIPKPSIEKVRKVENTSGTSRPWLCVAEEGCDPEKLELPNKTHDHHKQQQKQQPKPKEKNPLN